ncbi:MAG: alpha/beta hydrolase [Bacteroidales bacterium]|nr:alpha/beta hydrolase [Bacteroidales bacterium]
MIKKTLLYAAAALMTAVASPNAGAASTDPINPDGTYMFASRDTCDLYMDVYNPAASSQTTLEGKEKPTVIFMFGGGFIHGTRDDKGYSNWFRMLTENGYRVISIDYRLGLKGSTKVGVAQVNVLDKAIHMAVEDLFSATSFIIDNADQLGVAPDNIVISGSSAGAITVMQAEYEICNRTSWAEALPEDFRYAGVMAFSGAIFSRKGKVRYETAPAPTLIMHGTGDSLVPYKQIKVFNLGFFGGGKLVERFEKFGYNYNMYHFIDYGHEIANSMETTMDLQLRFLETNVIRGQKRIVEAWIDDPGVWRGSGPQSRKELYGK